MAKNKDKHICSLLDDKSDTLSKLYAGCLSDCHSQSVGEDCGDSSSISDTSETKVRCLCGC